MLKKDDQLKSLTGYKHPTAARCYDAIKAGKTISLLQPLQSLKDAQPGDVFLSIINYIAIRYIFNY